MNKKVLVALGLAIALVATPAFGAVIKYESAHDLSASDPGKLGGTFTGIVPIPAAPAVIGSLDIRTLQPVTASFSTVSGGVIGVNGYIEANLEVSFDGTDWYVEGQVTIKDSNGVFIVGWFESSNVWFNANQMMQITGTLLPPDPVDGDSFFPSLAFRDGGSPLGTKDVKDPDVMAIVPFASMEFFLCTDRLPLDIFFGSVTDGFKSNPICGGWVEVTFTTVPFPEPATMSLLALGGLALLRRRSSR